MWLVFKKYPCYHKIVRHRTALELRIFYNKMVEFKFNFCFIWRVKMKNIAIILASGTGERTGLNIPKQFVKVAGKTIFEHTLDTFEKHPLIDEIIVVSNINYIEQAQNLVIKNNYKKIIKILAGGATRRESSYIGISSINYENAKVLIHDAVRPFMHPTIINKCIDALDEYNAVDVAIESADTLIKINKNNVIEEIPNRKYYRRGQTPQAFDLKTIKTAHELANQEENISVTDDCGLILKFKLGDIYVVEGDDFNHKITYPIDIAIADKLFQMKSIDAPKQDKTQLKNKVLVVFGASKGIGESVVHLANTYGAQIYGFSRSNGVDVCDFESVKKALDDVYQKEHRIDYIVNTAGLLRMGQLNCREIDDIKNEIQVNYMGCVNIAHLAPKYLKETKGSLIFYTSSSYTRGRALYSIYSSTKAAIVNLVQALAEEWENEKIRINVINPERTATPMRFSNFGKEPEETLLKPEKVAEATLNTLLSDYTGQVIDVRRK